MAGEGASGSGVSGPVLLVMTVTNGKSRILLEHLRALKPTARGLEILKSYASAAGDSMPDSDPERRQLEEFMRAPNGGRGGRL